MGSTFWALGNYSKQNLGEKGVKEDAVIRTKDNVKGAVSFADEIS